MTRRILTHIGVVCALAVPHLATAQSLSEYRTASVVSAAAAVTERPDTSTAPRPAEPKEDETSTTHPPRFTQGVDFVTSSAYVWRGFVAVPSAVVQPNFWFKAGGLTVSSWSNMAADGPHGEPMTEHDLTVDYAVTRGSFTYSAGYINYVFPDLSADRVSHELYVGATHASYLAPTLRVYQDISVGSGTYVSAGIGHTYQLPWYHIAASPSITVGYNHRQWTGSTGFSDANLGLRLLVPTPVRHVSLAPFVNYSRSLDRSVVPSQFYGGIGISVQ